MAAWEEERNERRVDVIRLAVHHGRRPDQAPPTLPDNSIVADHYFALHAVRVAWQSEIAATACSDPEYDFGDGICRINT